MKRMNTYLTEQQREGLGKLSGKTGLCAAELIRRAVDKFLEDPSYGHGVIVERTNVPPEWLGESQKIEESLCKKV
jgi:hypothetical protein